MKTAAAHKLRLIQASISDGNPPSVALAGSDLRYRVLEVRNFHNTVILKVDRQQGFIAVDPDEIQLVTFPVIPKRFDAEAI